MSGWDRGRLRANNEQIEAGHIGGYTDQPSKLRTKAAVTLNAGGRTGMLI